MHIITKINEWPLIKITLGVERQAQAIRARRDAIYTNIYQEKASDLRWVGEVGELAFDWWLSSNFVDHTWVQENTAGKPDFTIGSHTVDVKTVKRKGAVRKGYTAQITAKHAHETVGWYFFTSYQYIEQTLWLLGAISQEDFLKSAKFYKAGDMVHSNYTVRRGHEIYNIGLDKLTAPKKWLQNIQQKILI